MEGIQFISCIRFSIQLLMAEGFFAAGLEKRKHFWIRLAAGLAGYLLLAWLVYLLFSSIPGNLPVAYTAYYISLFFLSLGFLWTAFQMTGKEMLFAGVCGYAAQHIGFAVYMIVQELSGLVLSGVWDFLIFRILPYLLVDLLVYFVLIRRYEGKSELKERDIRMILLALVILLTVVFLSVLVDSEMFRDESPLLRNVLCKIYAIFCCALSMFIAFSLSRQNRILHENEMMESMLHSLREQQKLSRENINIINIKCHDLKYRISRISKIENSEDQKEYIESIRNAVAIYDNIYQTGNDALDLVLTEKSLLCDEYNIKLSSMIDGSALNFMHTTDVYALFGNLLDNAIESVMKEADEEKRIISIQMSRKSQGYHIHMDNYCNEAIVFEEGLPVTTKEDKAYHGFGVRSIKYIVDKYKGDMLMSAGGQRFRVDILFYIS
ncbi:putative sensor histidine kinase VirS [Marvinbryantia formatexigens DSM 14469]|uniref:Sensor histidine kinase VirS n=1 Tax=Marvinbryantia formatexigens DSM 14469 TaxID=478749 RepID=C6LC47_9FIRM|nr:ATP-binding protein [Marvinbryantia formatexigens]EET62000.1 putative sensor histidine kinase VirS [Marvinbryantia formatexigens DSM 14469]UWO25674.1 ATP-binding protein [Marvinbryantia formatexigens DSM 14469]SDF32151.1 GHKL domain-containing protein [Marvinbryantia formatexigens]